MNSPIVKTVNCLDCGTEKSFTQVYVNRGRADNYRCRACAIRAHWAGKPKKTEEHKKTKRREYYLKNKDRLDAKCNEWRNSKRLEIIEKMGGQCKFCGEKDPIVLDIDHINDDGALERKDSKRKNVIYNLSKNGIDFSRYQLLCKNCNWRKEFYRRQYMSMNNGSSNAV